MMEARAGSGSSIRVPARNHHQRPAARKVEAASAAGQRRLRQQLARIIIVVVCVIIIIIAESSHSERKADMCYGQIMISPPETQPQAHARTLTASPRPTNRLTDRQADRQADGRTVMMVKPVMKKTKDIRRGGWRAAEESGLDRADASRARKHRARQCVFQLCLLLLLLLLFAPDTSLVRPA